MYLDRFDHFVTEVLRAPHLRYVDDFALFADDPARLEAWRGRLAGFLARRRLSLHPGEDARGVDVVADDVPRVRAAARRAPSAAGVERAAVPQPPARAPRPLAGGKHHSGRSGTAGSRLGGARTPTSRTWEGGGGRHRCARLPTAPVAALLLLFAFATPAPGQVATGGVMRFATDEVAFIGGFGGVAADVWLVEPFAYLAMAATQRPRERRVSRPARSESGEPRAGRLFGFRSANALSI